MCLGWSGLKYRLCGFTKFILEAGQCSGGFQKYHLTSTTAKSEAQGEASVTINQEGWIILNKILWTGKANSINSKLEVTRTDILNHDSDMWFSCFSDGQLAKISASLFGF